MHLKNYTYVRLMHASLEFPISIIFILPQLTKLPLHFFSHLLAVDEFVLKTITLTPLSFVGIKEQLTAH